MKRLVDFCVLFVICFLLAFLLKAGITVFFKVPDNTSKNIYFTGLSIIITFFLLGTTYKTIWHSDTFKRKISLLLFFVFLIFNPIFFFFIFKSNESSNVFYTYLMAKQTYGWKGNVHETNDTLGYSPIPNSSGSIFIPYSKDIPVFYDKTGFRTFDKDSVTFDESHPPEILFLGCSWTFGHPCNMRETFSYQTAKEKEVSYINAAVGGYGLSQMYILAKKLIPKYKPKYVVLQYSPWLADRGMSIYAPTYFGLAPTPYFTYTNNTYSFAYPAFTTLVYSIDKEELMKKYEDNYLSFYFNVGLSFYFNELISDTKYKIKILFNPELKPATNKDEVEKFAYTEMAKLAHENGAKVIILNIGDVLDGPKYSVYEKDAEKKLLNIADVNYTQKSKSLINPTIPVEFAQADSLLIDYLNNSESKNYIKEFGNWRFDGKDSVFVDGHPNPKAHRIIAKSILLKLAEKSVIHPNTQQ